MSLTQKFIAWISMRTPDFIIGGADNPYLIRWWLIPRKHDLTVVNAAIERRLQRAGEQSNRRMESANALGNPASAIRRVIGNDDLSNLLEAQARQRAGDLLDRAITHARAIRIADTQRRLASHLEHFSYPIRIAA